MEWKAVFFIGGLAAVAGTLLYLPFFIWFRTRARKSKDVVAGSFRYTTAGWIFMTLTLTALFGGFAWGKLDPTSWFGTQVTTLFGGLGYFFLVWLAFSAIEWGCRKLSIRLVHPLPSTQGEIDIPKADSPT
jgi:uncharacterized membrane protein